MNFNEVIDLLKAASAVPAETQGEPPKLCVYDTQDVMEGYVLCLKTKAASRDYMAFLKGLAEKRKLRVRQFRDLTIVYSAAVTA
ncbi:MAG: hypothetical protein ACE14S_03525 [Candidatus Bathyarchaeia archaeon]